MESDINPLLYIGLLVILILINAFFAMSEIAVISFNDNKLRRMAQEGDKKAQILLAITSEPSKFLATIQVGVTLSGFMASAVAADTFVEYIMFYLRDTAIVAAITPTVARTVTLLVLTLILAYLTLIFGELVPKRIAMQNYERVSMAVARPLSVIYRFSRPFVTLLSGSTNGVLQLIGIDPNEKPDEVTEEEIRMMIDVGSEGGNIPESDADMINNIFEFDDTLVVEIMCPRTEIEAAELDTPLQEVMDIAIETGYSRIPVYEKDLDSITGILYVKDLLGLVTKNPDAPFDLKAYMREAMFVFESTSCKSLLETFKLKKLQMAIVVDEYGGTSGLVTMEDLLEAIVGNIQDEYDDEPEDIEEIGPDTFMIDGMTPYEDVADFFGLVFNEEEADYDTLGGHILSLVGYIPAEDETPTVTVENIVFTVAEMDERRVSKVRAERVPPGETDEKVSD